jgi:hypothetical protein
LTTRTAPFGAQGDYTPLLIAMGSNQPAAALHLMEKGTDINAKNTVRAVSPLRQRGTTHHPQPANCACILIAPALPNGHSKLYPQASRLAYCAWQAYQGHGARVTAAAPTRHLFTLSVIDPFQNFLIPALFDRLHERMLSISSVPGPSARAKILFLKGIYGVLANFAATLRAPLLTRRPTLIRHRPPSPLVGGFTPRRQSSACESWDPNMCSLPRSF